jgi:hypothetical protein
LLPKNIGKEKSYLQASGLVIFARLRGLELDRKTRHGDGCTLKLTGVSVRKRNSWREVDGQ